MDETVTTWGEGRRIDTQNQPGVSVPFKQAGSTLTLEPDGDGTLATFDCRYVPRGGPFGRFTGPWIDRMLTATFTSMLAATEEAALANRQREPGGFPLTSSGRWKADAASRPRSSP